MFEIHFSGLSFFFSDDGLFWLASFNDKNHSAVCLIPCPSLNGNRPHTASISDISNIYSVRMLFRRKELKGKCFRPHLLRTSPSVASNRAAKRGNVTILGAPIPRARPSA